jgi:NADH-quinone oxidoreductase subunit I
MSSPSHSHHADDAPVEAHLVEPDVRERAYLPELLRGFMVTARKWVRNLVADPSPKLPLLDKKGVSSVVTLQYPEEQLAYPPGYRGLHRLVPREDGKPRCVACYMCATACPAQCIHIEAGEYEVDDASTESRVIEKYPVRFDIDELRCIVCGLCVDACPKDAIRMDTGRHTPGGYERGTFVYGIDRLLTGAPVSHPTDPWFKRGGSEAPEHQHLEKHARVGDEHSAATPAAAHEDGRR